LGIAGVRPDAAKSKRQRTGGQCIAHAMDPSGEQSATGRQTFQEFIPIELARLILARHQAPHLNAVANKNAGGV
jgi:hypothetical protein